MSRPPTVKDEIRQLQRWLELKYPTPFPVDTQWHTELDDWADTNLLGSRRFRIRMKTTLLRNRDLAVFLFLHEWAHCVSWPIPVKRWVDLIADHSDEWGLATARVYRGYYDEGGHIQCRELPWHSE